MGSKNGYLIVRFVFLYTHHMIYGWVWNCCNTVNCGHLKRENDDNALDLGNQMFKQTSMCIYNMHNMYIHVQCASVGKICTSVAIYRYIVDIKTTQGLQTKVWYLWSQVKATDHIKQNCSSKWAVQRHQGKVVDVVPHVQTNCYIPSGN